MRSIKTLCAWLELAALPKFATTLLPFTLGAVLAWSEGFTPDFLAFAVSLLAVFLLTAFCFVLNAASVFSDLCSARAEAGSVLGEGAKEGEKKRSAASSFHSTASTGRFSTLANGKITVKEATLGAYLCVILALPLGFLLQFYFCTGDFTLLLGFIGIFIAYSYSRGLRFSYRGLGELALAFGVGLLTVFSGFYLQARSLSVLPAVFSLPFVVEVFKMKLAREVPDYECDSAVNRRNLVVRFGKEFATRLYAPLTLIAWLSFVPVFLLVSIPPFSLPLLAAPAYFSWKSAILSLANKWKTREGTIEICKNGFTGMTLLPIALIAMLLLKMFFA